MKKQICLLLLIALLLSGCSGADERSWLSGQKALAEENYSEASAAFEKAGAFQDALQQIPQFTGLFCQRLYPFIVATQPSKDLEPVATLIRLFHCYCNFMDKIITAFRSIGFMVIGTYRTRALAKLMRNDLDRYIIR